MRGCEGGGGGGGGSGSEGKPASEALSIVLVQPTNREEALRVCQGLSRSNAQSATGGAAVWG